MRRTSRVRPASTLAQLVVGVLLASMLRGAHERADDVSDLSTPNASLAAVEHRALIRPQHAASQLALGEAYFREGRYADARLPLEHARVLTGYSDGFRLHDDEGSWQERVVPDNRTYARATLLYALTRAHLESGDAALDYYRQAYAMGAMAKDVTLPLLDALMKERRYAEAVEVIRRYQRDQGDDADMMRILTAAQTAEQSDVLARTGGTSAFGVPTNENVRRAEEEVRYNPQDAWAEAKLADAQLTAVLGDRTAQTTANFDVVATHVERAITLAPRNADYRAQLGLVLTLAKHYTAADSAFAEALALDPSLLMRQPGYRGAQAFARALASGRTPSQALEFAFSPPPRP